MEKILGCSFCFPSSDEKIIKETPNFYVVPSIGSIVEGYLLLNIKYHLPSYGCLDYQLLEEFISLKNEIRTALESVFSEGCIFYEHGRAGTSLKLQGTDKISYHAHLHCVAANIDLLARLSDDFEPIKVEDWSEIIKLEKLYSHYLYYEDCLCNMFFFPVKKYPRAQYLRSILAQELNNPDAADWRKAPNWEYVNSSYQKLSTHFNLRLRYK